MGPRVREIPPKRSSVFAISNDSTHWKDRSPILWKKWNDRNCVAKKKPSTPVAPKRMSTRRIWSTLSINGSGKGGRIQWETPRQHLRQQRTCSGNRGSRLERRTQVWSLSQIYSVGLLQSWIAVKLCACANTQSRFKLLMPSATHLTDQFSCISAVPEAKYEARVRALEGRCVILK